MAVSGANAFQFDFEPGSKWSGSLDSTITYGAMWRLNSQSTDLTDDWQSDDSNRNFNKGLVSNSVRILSDLGINFDTDNGDRYGLFSRFTAYYDDEIYNANTDYSSQLLTNYSTVTDENAVTGIDHSSNNRTLFDSFNNSTTYGGSTEPGQFTKDTEDAVGRGKELLDLFVFAELATQTDHPIKIQLGRQVISWGESAFIQNGISSVQNYADVNKAVMPGVEVKEILRPLGAVYGSVALSDNLTLQAYSQYEWEPYTLPQRRGPAAVQDQPPRSRSRGRQDHRRRRPPGDRGRRRGPGDGPQGALQAPAGR